MSNREQYAPGPAAGADVKKDGDAWTLVLVRELRHPPALVWRALTDPKELAEWAPRLCELAAEASEPAADLRGSVEYKRDLVRVLTARALRTALQRAAAAH